MVKNYFHKHKNFSLDLLKDRIEIYPEVGGGTVTFTTPLGYTTDEVDNFSLSITGAQIHLKGRGHR